MDLGIPDRKFCFQPILKNSNDRGSNMTVLPTRIILAFTLVIAYCTALPAQQVGAGGGITTGGDAGAATGAAGVGTGSTIGQPTASGAGGTMDAEVAFSAVERDATVGATGETGLGFSDLSAANQGGGAGIGGLGGFRGIGGGGFGGLGGLGSLFGGLNTQGQAARPAIRTRLRSRVLHEPHPPERVERRATQRFRSLSTPMSRPEMRGVNVTMEGRRAVLTGTVGSARDHRMSEMLMRLEPGVSVIENRLQIAGENGVQVGGERIGSP